MIAERPNGPNDICFRVSHTPSSLKAQLSPSCQVALSHCVNLYADQSDGQDATPSLDSKIAVINCQILSSNFVGSLSAEIWTQRIPRGATRQSHWQMCLQNFLGADANYQAIIVTRWNDAIEQTSHRSMLDIIQKR